MRPLWHIDFQHGYVRITDSSYGNLTDVCSCTHTGTRPLSCTSVTLRLAQTCYNRPTVLPRKRKPSLMHTSVLCVSLESSILLPSNACVMLCRLVHTFDRHSTCLGGIPLVAMAIQGPRTWCDLTVETPSGPPAPEPAPPTAM